MKFPFLCFPYVIIGVGDWRYKTFTGFTDYGMVNSPDQMSYGILGQLGFFEHFKVKFDYKRREIEIIPKLLYKEDFLERVNKSKQEINEGKTIPWNKVRSKIESE